MPKTNPKKQKKNYEYMHKEVYIKNELLIMRIKTRIISHGSLFIRINHGHSIQKTQAGVETKLSLISLESGIKNLVFQPPQYKWPQNLVQTIYNQEILLFRQ